MIVTCIFGIITIVFLVIMFLAYLNGNETLAITSFFLMMIFMVLTGITGALEPDEVRTACKTYCQEQGYSYDSVKTEGEEQYCVCDTGLERHLITKTNEVIIQ